MACSASLHSLDEESRLLLGNSLKKYLIEPGFVDVKIQDQISFLMFSDWHKEQARKAQDWTNIASAQKEEGGGFFSDFFTFSTLASTAKGNLKRLLSRQEWEVDVSFGRPSWGTDAHGLRNEISSSKGTRRKPPLILHQNNDRGRRQ